MFLLLVQMKASSMDVLKLICMLLMISDAECKEVECEGHEKR